MNKFDFFTESKRKLTSEYYTYNRHEDGSFIFMYETSKIFYLDGVHNTFHLLDVEEKTKTTYTASDLQMAYYEDSGNITILHSGVAYNFYNVRYFNTLPDMLANDSDVINLDELPDVDTVNMKLQLHGDIDEDSFFYYDKNVIINNETISSVDKLVVLQICYPSYKIYSYILNNPTYTDLIEITGNINTNYNDKNVISDNVKTEIFQNKSLIIPVDDFKTSNLKLASVYNVVNDYVTRWSS